MEKIETMKRQQESAAFCDAESLMLSASDDLTWRKNTPRAREMNQKKQDSPFLRGSLEEGKEGRKGNSWEAFTQAALNESYKPKNQNSLALALSASDAADLWAKVRFVLESELTKSAFSTWIDPLKPLSQEHGKLTVATENEFNREQILKRYGSRIKELLSDLTEEAISLKMVVVDPPKVERKPQSPASVAPVRALNSKRTPWAAGQNPTNNAEIDRLLDQYGDMRGILGL